MDYGIEPDDPLFLLKFKLVDGDLSRITLIENIEIEYCYQWLMMIKIKELNELKLRIEEWDRIKSD